MTIPRAGAALLLTAALCGCELPEPAPQAVAEPDVADLATRAESSGFLATSSLDETVLWLETLASRWDRMSLTTFGRSGEGRPMPLVVVSADGAFTPEDARAAGKPVVLVQNGIHAGEIDGKDASLILLRELAEGKHPDILDAMTLLVIPVYNVDGHERVSPYHRPNQDGPREGMGFRTTTEGLDLNRDHMKLDSDEARALMRLVSEWTPHLHVDNHVTNGVDQEWVVTWSRVYDPQLAAPVSAWLDEAMPAVEERTRAAGFPAGPYVSLKERLDPAQGIDSWIGPPRYSTGYFALRGIPSILVELHSHKPYETRVRGNHAFLAGLLGEVARRAEALTDAVASARAEVERLGQAGAGPSRVPLAFEPDDEAVSTIEWPVYAWSVRESPVFGPLLEFERGKTALTEVPWHARGRVASDVARPRGYVVLPGWSKISDRLLAHGLKAVCLTEPAELDVETIRVSNPRFAERPYQGRFAVTADVSRQVERRTVPAGAFWIPADQPDFDVAVQLLEPDAPDSLLAWGVLHSVFERKEYIGLTTLDDLVREMLKDPGVRAEWEHARNDPGISAAPGFAYEWWYRKTPFWDETVGLMPVYRVMHPPAFATAGSTAP